MKVALFESWDCCDIEIHPCDANGALNGTYTVVDVPESWLQRWRETIAAYEKVFTEMQDALRAARSDCQECAQP